MHKNSKHKISTEHWDETRSVLDSKTDDWQAGEIEIQQLNPGGLNQRRNIKHQQLTKTY